METLNPIRSFKGAASALGILRELTGAPGLAPDIIAMPGNPMEDIEALRKINFIMKDGRIVRRP